MLTLLGPIIGSVDIIGSLAHLKKVKHKTQSDKLFGLTRLWSSVGGAM